MATPTLAQLITGAQCRSKKHSPPLSLTFISYLDFLWCQQRGITDIHWSHFLHVDGRQVGNYLHLRHRLEKINMFCLKINIKARPRMSEFMPTAPPSTQLRYEPHLSHEVWRYYEVWGLVNTVEEGYSYCVGGGRYSMWGVFTIPVWKVAAVNLHFTVHDGSQNSYVDD